jgi:hypothetical protein
MNLTTKTQRFVICLRSYQCLHLIYNTSEEIYKEQKKTLFKKVFFRKKLSFKCMVQNSGCLRFCLNFSMEQKMTWDRNVCFREPIPELSIGLYNSVQKQAYV